ncbi:MAG: hypothetical protein CM15mP83_3210 [Flavobacteriaceae bacterium]|nr:MAG: hypothetical protein CM15mP83_3210 [Flavobacteriaceae bacterium]
MIFPNNSRWSESNRSLPLHLIGQSEVIRGLAGSRHGNAAGGVLSFFTTDSNPIKASIRLQRGSFGLLNSDATINQNLSIILPSLGLLNYQKWMDFATMLALKTKVPMSNSTYKNKAAHTISILHFDSPYAFDPGGLTIDEVSESRSQARKKNETYAAGESVCQSQMTWKYKNPISRCGEPESIPSLQPKDFR